MQRLAPDPVVARRGAFALFVLTYLEQVGLAPSGERYGERVAAASAVNAHLFAPFIESPETLDALDGRAALDLTRWAHAQRLDREEPQVAYELGLLALGVTLPPVLVGALRQLTLTESTRVVELPDGAGYPTVFLQTLHPHWPAGSNAPSLVTSTDARQLAAWAHLLLTRRLAPRAGAIVLRPADTPPHPLIEAELALLYNTPSDVDPRALVRAARFLVV